MTQNKQGYFQGGGGVNEPTPKNKKYKSEKTIAVQPRFKEPFYQNYDLYETEGVSGAPKHGPGTRKRPKNLKNKYISEDSWIKDKKDRMKARAKALYFITKNAIDFKIDDKIKSAPILEELGVYVDSTGIGGNLDEYLTLNDFEGKDPSTLNFGRDYDAEKSNKNFREYIFLKLLNQTLNPKETDLLGLYNGFESAEDLDADKTINNINPYYGTTNVGNLIYDKMWI